MSVDQWIENYQKDSMLTLVDHTGEENCVISPLNLVTEFANGRDQFQVWSSEIDGGAVDTVSLARVDLTPPHILSCRDTVLCRMNNMLGRTFPKNIGIHSGVNENLPFDSRFDGTTGLAHDYYWECIWGRNSNHYCEMGLPLYRGSVIVPSNNIPIEMGLLHLSAWRLQSKRDRVVLCLQTCQSSGGIFITNSKISRIPLSSTLRRGHKRYR